MSRCCLHRGRKDFGITVLTMNTDAPNNVTLDRKARRCCFQLHPASLTNVRGAENTYWGRRQVAKCVRKQVQMKLFDVFQLF